MISVGRRGDKGMKILKLIIGWIGLTSLFVLTIHYSPINLFNDLLITIIYFSTTVVLGTEKVEFS